MAIAPRRSLFAFVDEELGISKETASRLLAIVRSVSRDDALTMGGQRKAAAFIDLAKATPTRRDTATSLARRAVQAPSGRTGRARTAVGVTRSASTCGAP